MRWMDSGPTAAHHLHRPTGPTSSTRPDARRRFDRQIYVDMPDVNERKAIFDVHLRPIKTDNTVDITSPNKRLGSVAPTLPMCATRPLCLQQGKTASLWPTRLFGCRGPHHWRAREAHQSHHRKRKEHHCVPRSGACRGELLVEFTAPLVKVSIVLAAKPWRCVVPSEERHHHHRRPATRCVPHW